MRWIGLLVFLAVPPAAAQDMRPIPGGTFTMGDPAGEPDEKPKRVTVGPFRLRKTEVTNDDFARFVAATGYRTDIERSGGGYVWTDRWRRVAGVSWRNPHGPDDSISERGDHPVVQVSQRDAAANCAWRGFRLPSEAEWELAARGFDGRLYPWGNEPPRQTSPYRANFGTVACCAPAASDGWRRTAPAGQYAAGVSPFGIEDMAGNVWEWTTTRHPGDKSQRVIRGGGWGNNPWCLRASYRHGNPPDIGLDMVGFRCAADGGPSGR